MRQKIPDTLRLAVAERAAFCCEYCRLPEKAAFFLFQVDHIISVRHEGKTELDNLAYACPICNRKKGTDLGTLIESSQELIRFFNPRADRWEEHFSLQESGEIVPKTAIGIATV